MTKKTVIDSPSHHLSPFVQANLVSQNQDFPAFTKANSNSMLTVSLITSKTI